MLKKAFLIVVMLGVFLVGTAVVGNAAEKYIIGCEVAWAPFEWVSPSGDYVGFDCDVMRCIAILEGYEIEIHDTSFDSLIPGVQLGQFDIAASGISITAERDKVVDFSPPYWRAEQAILVRADSGLNIVTALAGYGPTKKIAAHRGTTGAKWVEENLVDKGVPIEIARYETDPECALAVKTKRADAAIQGEAGAKQTTEAYPELAVVGTVDTGEIGFGFVVAEGDPKGILPLLASGVRKLKASGAWDNLIMAYFGPELPDIEAAWSECISMLDEGDVEGFAACLAEKVTQ